MRASHEMFLLILSALTCFQNVTGFGGIEHLPHHAPLLQDALSTVPSNPMWISNSPESTIFISAMVKESAKVLDVASMAWGDYKVALKTHPYQTKIWTGVILAFVGDAIAQLREPAPYDKKRAAAFACFDAIYRAVQQFTYPPLIAHFQGQYLIALLANIGVQSVSPTSAVATLSGPLETTLISQLVIIPIIYYPVFYAVTGAVQGLTIDQTVQRAKDTFIPLMKRNLLFWIPVQFGTFGFVQEDLQIPLLILCGLAWTVILSISAGAINTADDKDINEDVLTPPEIHMSKIDSNGVTNQAPVTTKTGEKETKKAENLTVSR